MTIEPINFREALANKKGDSRLWSPEDALESVLRDLRAGAINPKCIAIHYFESLGDGNAVHRCVVANLTREEHIALLALAQNRELREWLV